MVEEALRLAAIVESSDDAIVSKDLNGVVTSWNRAAEKMFGYSAEEMIGQSIRTIIPADRQSEEDQVLASIRRGEPVEHFETVRQRKDGSMVPISLSVSPIRNADGRVIGASKIARDITERLRIEAERERLTAAVQEAGRVKDEFLATLSHELRTPLNAILGYARMMRLGIVPAERQPRAIETIERNASSLTQIVEDVLDISRIVAGKMRLQVQPTDIVRVAGDAIDAVRPAADAKQITLETAFESDHLPIAGDPDRLQQVVWNLMSNAVKFTPFGGNIRLAANCVDNKVHISIQDSGIGIAPEFLPHLFERFRQAESGSNRESGGLGIGLSIARELIEMHGGTITATSDGPGRGATFRVMLPAAAARLERQTERQLLGVEGGAAGRPADLHGLRILVVDDDDDALMLVREILEQAGAQVETASSGAQALDAVGTFQPDVLVSDIAMPRMDGFELIARIRSHANDLVRQVPAAALTAYARSDDSVRARRSGFQMHLAKPIDPVALTAAIAGLAGRSETERAAR